MDARRITVDLKTRFIPDDNRVFIVFPGESYRYYETMAEHSAIFLDLPGFPVPEGPLAAAPDLVERVVVSDLVREWHKKGSDPESLPPRLPEDLDKTRSTKRRKQLAGMMENLFGRLKRGDVIVIPPRSLDEDVLYGEIDSDRNEVALIPDGAHPGEFFPARKVRWIARQPRMTVPGWLERKLPNQNPIRQIERSSHKYIYDYMYQRYFFDGQFVCKFRIDAPHFSSLDDFLIQQIFLYTSALYAANRDGSLDKLQEQSIAIIASSIKFSQDIPDQRVFISSPGNIFSYARNIVPLIAGLLMTMSATFGEEAFHSIVTVVNSADASAISLACQADIAAEVMEDMKAMGYARWQELCSIEMRARERTQIESGMSVTRDVPLGPPPSPYTGSLPPPPIAQQ